MTLPKIAQIHTKVMAIANMPRNLSLINAYIDQALMNFSYEQMPRSKQKEALRLFAEMLDKFNKVRGR